MGRPLSLRPRLMAVTEWIRPADRVADIGTDHARLPVYLAQRGLAAKVYALDIAEGPLLRAGRTVAIHHMEEKVCLIRSDGATGLSADCVDTVVITGMGGESIFEIVKNAPWLREKRMIAGPHTYKDELPEWLKADGYCLREQKDVLDAGREYRLYLFEGGEGSV